jgi:putative transposase
MPSIARTHQLKQSLLYHVYNRGNARNQIFHDKEDYLSFINLISSYSEKHGFLIYHWALMPNHYHLLLEIEKPERLSSIMSGLARSYVYRHHGKYQSCGHLWQGRFQSQPIQKELYLLICGRYIERNPVNANLVTYAEDYPYSSASYYVRGMRNNLTTEDPLFVTFANEITQRRKEYKHFLETFDSEQENLFENLKHPQGSKEFISKLVNDKGLYLPRRRGRAGKERILT